VTTTISKGKNETSCLQLELENKLCTTEITMQFTLERNLVLERDVVCVKEELNKSLKWTTFSKMLTNLTSQGNNSRRGLSCEKIDPLYNPHIKYISVADNLLCVHCGRNGHLKKDCPVWKKYEGSSSNYSKRRNRQNKGPGLASGPKLKKISLPH